MGWFEAQYVYTYEIQILLCVRFIDDIFLIWTHGHDALKTIENHLNDCVSSMKFETDIFRESTFPRCHCLSDKAFCLILSTPNLQMLIIIWASNHVTQELQNSQFLRVHGICSSEDDFIKHSREMAHHFLRANYPAKIVQKEGFLQSLSQR